MPSVTESAPFVIDPASGNLPAYPEGSTLADGRVVVVWQETVGDADIKGKILNSDGSTSVAEFMLNTSEPGQQIDPTVVGLANGGFVAAWWDQNDGYIHTQAFNSTGAMVGVENDVRTVAGNPELTLASLTGGNYVLGSNSGWQVFQPDGQAVTPLTISGNSPQIVPLNDGGFGVVVFGADIYLQTYSASGVAGATITMVDLPSTPPEPGQPTTSYSDFQVAQLDNGDLSMAYVVTTTLRNVPPYFSIVHATASASDPSITANTLVAFPNFQSPNLEFQLVADGFDSFVHFTDQAGEHLAWIHDGVVTSLDAEVNGQIDWGVENQITPLGEGGFLVTSSQAGGGIQGQTFTVTGTDFVQHGTPGDDTLTGTAGDDSLYGEDGNDTLIGGGGTDHLQGEAGDDALTATGASQMFGGTGDDTYHLTDATAQAIERPDEGYDTVESSVDLTLAANLEALVLVGGASNGAGNASDNVLSGNALDNSLQGLDGNDSLFGGDGQDSLFGGVGDDAVYGQAGDDTLYGWTGADRIEGGAGVDTLYGEDGADTLYGEDGSDTLYAGTGDDFLAGQDGADLLWGEAGADFLYGGAGGDQLAGGADADLFYYQNMGEGGDSIIDFSSAESDRIVVDGAAFGAFAGFQLTAGLGFLSGAGVTPVMATATFFYDTATLNLWYDIDGTGAGQSVLIAQMASAPTLHAYDFIFA